MDIAAVSMGLSQMQVSQQASISVMKMAMETGETQLNNVVEMATASTTPTAGGGPAPNPYIGQNLDITV
jgi:hypothetical protein